MSKFDLNTPIQNIFSDPKAKAALEMAAPKLAANPMLAGLPISLNQMAAYAGGKLPKETLDRIESALQTVD